MIISEKLGLLRSHADEFSSDGEIELFEPNWLETQPLTFRYDEISNFLKRWKELLQYNKTHKKNIF